MTTVALYLIAGGVFSVCSWALSDAPPGPIGLAVDGLLWPVAVVVIAADWVGR